MPHTPIYIICSPRPLVGKTLIARLLSEFLLLKNGEVAAFDINLKEPSLLEYLPDITETAEVDDTFGKMALMDRLIVNDGVAKVIDLGFHAFDEFFKMSEEIGFMKEAARRGVSPVILFVADTDRVSARGYPMLQQQIPATALVTIDNEYVVRGELPPAMAHGRVLRIARAAGVPEDLYRPADVLVHRLSAQREGFINRTASMDPQELPQLPRARAEFDLAEVVRLKRPACFSAGTTRFRFGGEVTTLNAPRTPSAFAPAHPSPAISPHRRGPAGR